MGKLVYCAYCGSQTVDKNSDDYARYNNKNYHKICCEKQKEKDSFFHYVCFIMGLKSPGPRIYSLAAKYITEKNYTYKGMENTLYYIYEVKKHKDKFDIENKTIGLIPYYYEDAQRYFNKIEFKKSKIEETANKILKEEKVIKVKIEPHTQRKLTYNIDEV